MRESIACEKKKAANLEAVKRLAAKPAWGRLFLGGGLRGVFAEVEFAWGVLLPRSEISLLLFHFTI